jgi:hemoglobin-like flavoprotein
MVEPYLRMKQHSVRYVNFSVEIYYDKEVQRVYSDPSPLDSAKRMTPAQLRLLQRSFGKVEPVAEHFGTIFYERLFAIAPEMKPLFRRDIKAQQSKFMKVIGEVVQLQLRAMISLPATAQASGEAVLPGSYWSGKLHAAYGVRMEDFDSMKQALVWALEQILKDDLTPDVQAAWIAAYDIIVRAMQTGMESPDEEEVEPEIDMQTRLQPGEDEEDESGTAFLKMLGER